jgi:hypothetical protein
VSECCAILGGLYGIRSKLLNVVCWYGMVWDGMGCDGMGWVDVVSRFVGQKCGWFVRKLSNHSCLAKYEDRENAMILCEGIY